MRLGNLLRLAFAGVGWIAISGLGPAQQTTSSPHGFQPLSCPSCSGGVVFLDFNNNQVYDSMVDALLPSWTVRIYRVVNLPPFGELDFFVKQTKSKVPPN